MLPCDPRDVRSADAALTPYLPGCGGCREDGAGVRYARSDAQVVWGPDARSGPAGWRVRGVRGLTAPACMPLPAPPARPQRALLQSYIVACAVCAEEGLLGKEAFEALRAALQVRTRPEEEEGGRRDGPAGPPGRAPPRQRRRCPERGPDSGRGRIPSPCGPRPCAAGRLQAGGGAAAYRGHNQARQAHGEQPGAGRAVAGRRQGVSRRPLFRTGPGPCAQVAREGGDVELSVHTASLLRGEGGQADAPRTLADCWPAVRLTPRAKARR